VTKVFLACQQLGGLLVYGCLYCYHHYANDSSSSVNDYITVSRRVSVIRPLTMIAYDLSRSLSLSFAVPDTFVEWHVGRRTAVRFCLMINLAAAAAAAAVVMRLSAYDMILRCMRYLNERRVSLLCLVVSVCKR